jgi:outer membrane receptor protein involved in Fe transport
MMDVSVVSINRWEHQKRREDFHQRRLLRGKVVIYRTSHHERGPNSSLTKVANSVILTWGKQKLAWTVNASNLFDNRVRTFPGVPEIGRMIMTRLQYSF